MVLSSTPNFSIMRAFALLIALPVISSAFALPDPQSGVASTSPTRNITKLARLGVVVAFPVAVANYLYTYGRIAYNAFVSPSLPSGYFAYGDVDSSCTQIHMEGLKFCEDAKLWHTTDAEGRVIKRVIATCDRNRFACPTTHASPPPTNGSLLPAVTGTPLWYVSYTIHSKVMLSSSSKGPYEGPYWQRWHLRAYLCR